MKGSMTSVATTSSSSGELSPEEAYRTAFRRNLGLVQPAEQQELADKRVLLLGAGGVGGNHAVVLARLGVGSFRVVDPDTFELANFNRQAGARMSTIGRAKAEVVAEDILEINPAAKVEPIVGKLEVDNAQALFEGVDLAVDGLDAFALEARKVAYPAARSAGVTMLNAGPLGMSVAMTVFTPDGMPFERYYDLRPEHDRFDQLIAFMLGTAPALSHLPYMDMRYASMKEEYGPSLGAACLLCAGVVGVEAMRILLGRPGLRPVPHYYQFDPYRGRLFSGRLIWGNRGPLQRLKRWRASKILRAQVQ